MKFCIQVALIATIGATTSALFGGCHSLNLNLKDASVQQPSNVALHFSMTDKDGNPVTGLNANDFLIFEDGQLISSFESQQTILNPEVATVRYTLLLLDMSGSVVHSGQIPLIQEAVEQFLSALGEDEHVAIYAFDGREEIIPIAEFGSEEKNAAKNANKLSQWEVEDPSTNLNGAIVNAVEKLVEAKTQSDVPLRSGTLVIFTDGTDRAHRATVKDAVSAIEDGEIDTYVIGLGGEVDQKEMQRLSSDEVLHIAEKEKVVTAFVEMGEKLKSKGKSYYLLSYCSPARAGEHELTVEVTVEEETGKLTYDFDAAGFEPECDPYATPNFKPMKDAKKQETARRKKMEAGVVGKNGIRQVEDDESPFDNGNSNRVKSPMK